MKAGYDFSQARRSAVAVESGKTRVTIRLDNDVLDWYRKQAKNMAAMIRPRSTPPYGNRCPRRMGHWNECCGG